VKAANNLSGGAGIPPPQNNLRAAVEKAVESLADQNAEQLAWLGAAREGLGQVWKLPVLDDVLEAHLDDGRVLRSDGQAVGLPWQIIVLHYLAMRTKPELGEPEVTFPHLPDGLVYAVNYEARVIGRLCATAGRDAETLQAAASALNATPASGGSLAFDFDVLPRLRLRLIWHAGDDEFGPSAAILLPRNIVSLMCIEDVVVMSEQLVRRLTGKPF
jgi:hypothetical protein